MRHDTFKLSSPIVTIEFISKKKKFKHHNTELSQTFSKL